MISIKHSLNVIHYISQLIRPEKCKNTQFINSAKKLEAVPVFLNDWDVASG
jgi:hypothetical protein